VRHDVDHQPSPVEAQIGDRRADQVAHGAVGSVAAHDVSRGHGLLGSVAVDGQAVDAVADDAQRAHRDPAPLIDRRDRVDAVLEYQFEVRSGETRHLRVARGRVQRVAGLEAMIADWGTGGAVRIGAPSMASEASRRWRARLERLAMSPSQFAGEYPVALNARSTRRQQS